MTPYAPRRMNGTNSSQHVERPVFGVDIDGTLGLYHEHFTRFAEGWLGRSLNDPKEYVGGPFWSYLGLSKATYRKVKLAYRRGGLKRSMPVADGASVLTSSLRKRGAIIVLCTTRPYLSMENIDEDTRHWARRNKIAHDQIMWGEHKYQDLSRLFGPERIVATLDDDTALAQQSADCGLSSFLVDRSYNQANGNYVNWIRVPSLYDAKLILHSCLDLWEKENR